MFSEVTEGTASIHVRDDGQGIIGADLGRLSSRLNERVEAVGGLVTVDSGGADGTEVKITVGAR
jgi:signal transduction histidine kinase